MSDNLICGTPYFLSLAHAIRYYRKQHSNQSHKDVAVIVSRKIADCEIFIGDPECPENARLVVLDDGCRYGIERQR